MAFNRKQRVVFTSLSLFLVGYLFYFWVARGTEPSAGNEPASPFSKQAPSKRLGQAENGKDPPVFPANARTAALHPALVPLSLQAGANHSLTQLPRRARPAVPSSRVDLQALKDQKNLQPSLDPEASILQPGTQPFEILVSGVPEVVHAALNEVYVQRPDGTAEILEIPPVQDLAGWEASARELSQTPEVVLYRPELPRAEANLVTLGTTMVLTEESPTTANEIIAAEDWRLVEAPVYAPGRYIVAAASPVVTLETLRRWKQLGRSNLEGNFRRHCLS